SGPPPGTACAHFEPVLANPLAGTDLAPHLDPPAASRHLCEREAERGVARLRHAVHVEETRLEPVELRLFFDWVLDQWLYAGELVGAHRRLADVRRLQGGRDAERVGRIRLVAVLAQPDRLVAEVGVQRPGEAAEVRHRDHVAVATRAGER